MKIDEALRQADLLRRACKSDPGLWNLLQAEQEWALYGDACDPLSPSAPEYALKAFQHDIYVEVWGRALAAACRQSARALLAGGGTGRFAQALLDLGCDVDLVDASPSAIDRAHRHLGNSVHARVGDLTSSETLAPQTYDLILAVEVPCYATNPSGVMANLRHALKARGTLLYSVEANPGALLADNDLASPEAATALLDDGVITLPGLKHVHYYTRDEAAELARAVDLQVLSVDGVCYVPDGPLGRLIDATRLNDSQHLGQLKEVERRCRAHPVLRDLPRAWAVSAVAQ